MGIVSKNGMRLSQVADFMQDDEDVVLAAIRQNPFSIICASLRLQLKENIMLEAVSINGLVLRDAFCNKSNRNLVLTAVKQNGLALEFANFIWRDDLKIVLEAFKKNNNSIKFAENRAKNYIKRLVFFLLLIKKLINLFVFFLIIKTNLIKKRILMFPQIRVKCWKIVLLSIWHNR